MADTLSTFNLDDHTVERVAVATAGYGVSESTRADALSSEADDLWPVEQVSLPLRKTVIEAASSLNLGAQRRARQLRARARDARFTAASCFIIAASYLSLRRREMGQLLWSAAAAEHARIDSSLAYVLAICAGEREPKLSVWFDTPFNERRTRESVEGEVFRDERRHRDQGFHELLASVAKATESRDGDGAHPYVDFNTTATWNETATVGNTHLPAALFIRVFDEMATWIRTAISDAPSAGFHLSARELARLLNAFAFELEQAQLNGHLWRQLLGGLLPVEPEVLATAITAIRIRDSVSPDLPSTRVLDGQLTPMAAGILELAGGIVLASRVPKDWTKRVTTKDLMARLETLREG